MVNNQRTLLAFNSIFYGFFKFIRFIVGHAGLQTTPLGSRFEPKLLETGNLHGVYSLQLVSKNT